MWRPPHKTQLRELLLTLLGSRTRPNLPRAARLAVHVGLGEDRPDHALVDVLVDQVEVIENLDAAGDQIYEREGLASVPRVVASAGVVPDFKWTE